MVVRPASFSLDQLKSYSSHTQITMLQCEEGWSYIAEWIGVPLSHVLDVVGVLPQARYVVYFSFEPDTWESIDMADALHPQTLLTYGMNGDELPVRHGGPLRLRLPRQVGFRFLEEDRVEVLPFVLELREPCQVIDPGAFPSHLRDRHAGPPRQQFARPLDRVA